MNDASVNTLAKLPLDVPLDWAWLIIYLVVLAFNSSRDLHAVFHSDRIRSHLLWQQGLLSPHSPNTCCPLWMAILTGVRQCINEVLARIPLTDPSHWTSFHFSVTICSSSTERHLCPLLICNPYFSFLLLSCMNSLYKFWVLTPQHTNGLKFCRLALYSVDFFSFAAYMTSL